MKIAAHTYLARYGLLLAPGGQGVSGPCDDGGHDWAFIERLATLGEQVAALLGK